MTRSEQDARRGRPGAGPVELSELPPAIPSLRRTVGIGYRAEPRLLVVSFLMVALTALPDALIALWLKLLVDGVLAGRRAEVIGATAGLAASATLLWVLSVVLERTERRFRDRVGIALESHVARLQASVSTVEHQERPEYLDRLSVLRDQVFALDHLFLSLFSMAGWIVRLAVTLVLLATIHPALVLLALFALPNLFVATWRPGVERRVDEAVAADGRLARHLFVLGTTAGPGKEVRLSGIQAGLRADRTAAWQRWYRPKAHAQVVTGLWGVAAWALFGLAYVGAVVFVAAGLDAGPGSVLLVLAAGNRLSQYVGAAVGELGFLRGIWLDSSRRLHWLERFAQSLEEDADGEVPARLSQGITFEHVSFAYPGTDRLVLDDVSLHLPAGTVVAVVGENGAGKTTLVKLLTKLYRPTAGRITVDGIDLARLSTPAWRQRLAGAFQDFFRFELRALNSVGVGDQPRMDDRPAVEGAAARAGADDVIDRLAHGLDTQLGPTWDEGVEVSYGQWQKLALARGFMRPDPLLLVLDEPTSALDAETEHALFERYADAAATGVDDGRITVLISHRFSTVRMADLIVVMAGARVAEVGSHDELMARGGTYADLYRIQATAYH